MNTPNDKREIARFVFSGSTTMIGVCITVIALFKITNTGIRTYADEILSLDTFIFISSAYLSYLVLRSSQNRRLEKFADALFFVGMSIMLLVGILIVFFTY
ncbi:MAG: hypothetical protein JSU03_04105 [Bacteroidetes bacterium]|nr:hypothetical protein [Bacteroidota bacterium]MBS1756437.1 hypothetical protein [Bacteroidota bacterium]